MTASVVPFKMTEKRAREIHRAAADDSSRIVWIGHAKQQMRKRKISPTQVLDCLRHGVVVEPLHLDIKGCWKCTLKRLTAGEEVKVAVAISKAEQAIIVTVMG